MELQICPHCDLAANITDDGRCTNCGAAVSNGDGAAQSAVNPFRDEFPSPQSTAPMPTASAPGRTVFPPSDAAAAIAVLQQASTQNRLPPTDYIEDRHGLWNYSDMPNCCPQCGNKFYLKDHRRRLRKRSWALIALSCLAVLVVGLVVPFVRGYVAIGLEVLLILGILMMPKAVFFKCYRCKWQKKFIVRSGVSA